VDEGPFRRVLAAEPDLAALAPREASREAPVLPHRTGAMYDPGWGLPRIHFPRTLLNKGSACSLSPEELLPE
jgi:hypothetical protein